MYGGEVMRFIYLFFLVFTIACGGSKNTQSDTSKGLFSTWTAQSTGLVDDYTRGSFTSSSSIVFDSCTCNAVFTGNQSTGTIQLSGCTPVGAYCNVWSASAPLSYSKVGSSLTVGSEHYQ